MSKHVGVLVVGAGLSGLVSAFYLKEKGKNILVVEKSNRPGGVIETGVQGGYVYERGPNTGIVANAAVEDLFSRLPGCTIELANPVSKKRFILKDDVWHALPNGLVSGLTTPLFNSFDKLRILGEPFRSRGTNPDETLASFVRRRLGGSFLDYAVDPFVKGVYAGDPNTLVVRHAMPKLFALEQRYGSLVRGSVLKAKDDRRNGVQKSSRATFSASGGLSSLTNALYNAVGKDSFLLGSRIINVEAHDNSYKVIVDVGGQPVEIVANKIVSTVPAHQLPDVLPFVEKRVMENITNLKYSPVVVVALGFDSWNGVNTDGFGGLIPSKEDKSMLGVLYMSSLFANRAPLRGRLFNVFVGGANNPSVAAMNDDEIIGIVQREFSLLMKNKEFDPSLLSLQRHPCAIPQYDITTQSRLEAIAEIETRYAGVIIGGNARDGIGMADRILQAKTIAEKL